MTDTPRNRPASLVAKSRSVDTEGNVTFESTFSDGIVVTVVTPSATPDVLGAGVGATLGALWFGPLGFVLGTLAGFFVNRAQPVVTTTYRGK
jgi:hypothetical protein